MTNNILYLSNLCSANTWNKILKISKYIPGQAVQKFHRLLIEGLESHDYCKTGVLSTLPVSPKSTNKRFWNIKSEKIGNVDYEYIPFINIHFIKEICIFFFMMIKIILWRFKSWKNRKTVICDVLNATVSFSALIACKLTSVKIIAIVTDIPGYMVNEDSIKSLRSKLFTIFVKKLIVFFDGYILLTEYMNPVVNPKNKPFMIMEGVVDIKMDTQENDLQNKNKYKVLLYAGGIYKKYGVQKLIEAFMNINDPLIRLYIYGNGDLKKIMPIFCKKDNRIIYHGIKPNEEVVAEQIKSTLLINPRPNSLKLAKFSFPSKNMEYMVSGTPVVTFPLSGMPKEYHNFVFLFEDETVENMAKTIRNILSLSKESLHEKGKNAKSFVIQNKNNYKQAERILTFINSLSDRT